MNPNPKIITFGVIINLAATAVSAWVSLKVWLWLSALSGEEIVVLEFQILTGLFLCVILFAIIEPFI